MAMVVEVGVIIEEKWKWQWKQEWGWMSRVAVNEEDSGSNRRIDCGKENESNYRNGGGLGIASRG